MFKIDFAKLRREWKTFLLAIVTTAVGAWQFAVVNGASLPNLLSWVPAEYQSGVLFIVGILFLGLRKYVDDAQVTTVETVTTETTTVTPAPTVPNV